MDILKKCYEFDRGKKVIEAGLYPFFQALESTEGTEVVMNGHKVLMLGSNNYLGLTFHPKIREAAQKSDRHLRDEPYWEPTHQWDDEYPCRAREAACGIHG